MGFKRSSVARETYMNPQVEKISGARHKRWNEGDPKREIDKLGKELDRLYAEERQADAKTRRVRADPFWRARESRRQERRARSAANGAMS